MRRKASGFTIIEIAVVVAIIGILATLAVMYGRSARQAGDLASLSWELSIRANALRPRAMATNQDFLLLVAEGTDPAGCRWDASKCGKAVVFSNAQPGFAISGFDPDGAYSGVDYQEQVAFPRNAKLDTTDAWTAPPPFSSVTAMDSGILGTCKDGRRCFAIRYRLDGTVEPVPAAGGSASSLTPARAGFALILQPVFAESGAAERRALFISFPTGIVKTAVF